MHQVIEDTLYVFHGRRKSEDHAPISALDLTSGNWTTLSPGGIPPPYPLIFFSSWAYKKGIYIFGGMVLSKHLHGDYDSDRLSNEFFYYNVSSNRWEWPSVSGIWKILFLENGLLFVTRWCWEKILWIQIAWLKVNRHFQGNSFSLLRNHTIPTIPSHNYHLRHWRVPLWRRK